MLWQVGRPFADNGRIYSDLPVQVYDWDGDGHNEVLFVHQARYVQPDGFPIRERAFEYEGNATLVVLDAARGKEKRSLVLPAPADDSLAFADLTGRGRRQDLIVKDRYWNLWGVAHEGAVLWHWEGSTGHYPALADLDGDGKDEVFVGFALLDHDGGVIFQKDIGPPEHHHADATFVIRMADGTWRLYFGNHGLHCLDLDGTERWFHPLSEAQHVVADHFRTDSEFQLAVIERGYPRTIEGKPAVLYLYDPDGREIWRREQPRGSWCAAAVAIDWLGGGSPKGVLVYGRGPGQPIAIYNGRGEIVEELSAEPSQPDSRWCCTRADVWGDSREEVIAFSSRGVCIWANARPPAIPTLYNHTHYPGM